MNTKLPIYEALPAIRNLLVNHNTGILQAPPGAGKSTVLPLELLDATWLAGKKIIMLEPRRLAARSVAGRLAQLLNEKPGETTGFRIRFETKVSAKTRIEVVTEGILTRMLQNDNSLEGVGLVIFDEFHERSLNADLALALCRQAQQILRPDLRILIMSATLETEALSSALGNVPVVQSLGKQYPVDICYEEVEIQKGIPAAVVRVIKKAAKEREGDLLVFLPGAGEINRTKDLLENDMQGISIVPLYGDLPFDQQQEAILPDKNGRRKIVLATSIAETSLTIEGIHIVVDSGFSRVANFDPRSGLSRLDTVTVTKDSADQRAGRAGRLGPGFCYRMWSEGKNGQLILNRKPEILNADLSSLMLELSNWGISDTNELSWPTPPPPGHVVQALELLEELDAIHENRITRRGKEILSFPAHPRIAHMLLEGKDAGLAGLSCDVAAILEERDPLPPDSGSDIRLRVEALIKYRKNIRVNADSSTLQRIERISASWRSFLKTNAHSGDAEETGKLITAAYPERIALQMDAHSSRYKLNNGKSAKLPEVDPLIHEKWLAIAQMDAGQKEGRIFLAAPVRPEELESFFQEKNILKWDKSLGILVANAELRIGTLPWKSQVLKNIPSAESIPILCEAIRNQPDLLDWAENVSSFQNRILSLKTWRTKEEWPDLSTTALLASTEKWLSSSLAGIKKTDDFKRIKILDLLRGMLSWDLLQMAERFAPSAIEVPTGSKINLEYFHDGKAPVLAVRLQEMFGQMETPTVNEGRNPVLIHLLSPAYRPAAVTQDLRSFWQNAYPDVRKDLRGRYPKHSWPEDPFTAVAVKGVKRKG